MPKPGCKGRCQPEIAGLGLGLLVLQILVVHFLSVLGLNTSHLLQCTAMWLMSDSIFRRYSGPIRVLLL